MKAAHVLFKLTVLTYPYNSLFQSSVYDCDCIQFLMWVKSVRKYNLFRSGYRSDMILKSRRLKLHLVIENRKGKLIIVYTFLYYGLNVLKRSEIEEISTL